MKEKMKAFISDTIKFSKLACVFIVVKSYFIDVSMTAGPSMIPTLADSGDWILVDKWHTLSNVTYGDVIVATSPVEPAKSVCKRIVALPGDPIPYERCDTPILSSLFFNVIPPGHVWVEGDNPKHSLDSRQYGPIPIGLLQGRVICKVWPLREIGRPLGSREFIHHQ